MTPSGRLPVTAGQRTREGGIDRRRRRQALRSSSQPDLPGARRTTLLLVHPGRPGQLDARRNRWWTRLTARLLAPRLDSQLARGRSPEVSGLLSARAQVLVSPAMRLSLADNWVDTLGQARRPPVVRDPRVPLHRSAIVSSEPDIRAMIEALVAPVPVPARGCAIASWLLCDGTGPLYDRRGPARLAAAVREATAHLDPGAAL